MKIILYILIVTATIVSGFYYLEDEGVVRVGFKFVPSEDTEPVEVYFCPEDNCTDVFLEMIDISKDIDCALFDIDIDVLIEGLKERGARLVIDEHNTLETEGKIPYIVVDDSSQLMHNKFCIFDSHTVMTGSWNPTYNGANNNNNNLIIIRSRNLAENYRREFHELWSGRFGEGKAVKYPLLKLNGKIVENYFCPEDHCQEHVLELLESAEESIYFMTFSFTDKEIAEVLLKKDEEGLVVRGIMEKRRISMQYNVYNMLKGKIDVIPDNNPDVLHHKVFVIDGKTVITGSYNPTASGDSKNDENIIIFHDRQIADKYLTEYGRLLR